MCERLLACVWRRGGLGGDSVQRGWPGRGGVDAYSPLCFGMKAGPGHSKGNRGGTVKGLDSPKPSGPDVSMASVSTSLP